MKFSYHWKDYEGIDHFTDNHEEADKALHQGYLIMLVPNNGRVAG